MKKRILPLLLAACFAAPTHAEDGVVVLRNLPELIAQAGSGDAWRRWAEDFSTEMRLNLGTMYGPLVGSAKAVKGAPYSAEVSTETSQSLADGNVISKKTQGRVYRDGEGRTRQEGSGSTIHIHDPVAAKSFILSPGTKSATGASTGPGAVREMHHAMNHQKVLRIGAHDVRVENGKVFLNGREISDGKVELQSGGKDIRVEGGKIYLDGKEFAPEGGHKVIVKRVDSGDPASGEGKSVREEVRVEVLKSGDGKEFSIAIPPVPPVPPVPGVAPVPPVPPLPGAFTMRFDRAKLGKGVTTSLGMKDFDGVKAEGKSTVWTIPAGEIGNRNPIQVTSESWYAPELQVTVYSRHFDPRQGEIVYRLSGIKRAEPAPELFKVPEGYTVREKSMPRAPKAPS